MTKPILDKQTSDEFEKFFKGIVGTKIDAEDKRILILKMENVIEKTLATKKQQWQKEAVDGEKNRIKEIIRPHLGLNEFISIEAVIDGKYQDKWNKEMIELAKTKS